MRNQHLKLDHLVPLTKSLEWSLPSTHKSGTLCSSDIPTQVREFIPVIHGKLSEQMVTQTTTLRVSAKLQLE